MDLSQFLLGVVVGVTASIPLGPIGVLCVQRTLNNNFKTGFISGLGAATADTIFSIVAMFFLSIVMSFIESQMLLFSLIGGCVMTCIGLYIYTNRKKVIIRRNRKSDRNIFRDYLSVLLLTLTNPAFILVFVTLFATFGVDKHGDAFPGSLLTIVGVTTGCSLWWFTLTFTVNLLRRKFRPRHLLYINITAGIIISLLGVSAIVGAIYSYINHL